MLIKKYTEQYKGKFDIEVLSGSMMVGEKGMPNEKIGAYIRTAYKCVEENPSVFFGLITPVGWFTTQLKTPEWKCIKKEL